MEFVNETGVAAGWTMGFDRTGRELLVVVVKATFLIPSGGGEVEVAPEQMPLTAADTFTGEPGLSAPVHECDYAHHRPMCDVILNGSAYAPGGDATTRVDVGIRVGSMSKVFAVVGNRMWRTGTFGIRASGAQPFMVMPISYDNAFGGVDQGKNEGDVRTFLENPVGRGFSHYKQALDGRPLPNTEEPNRTISDPGGSYRPMALGAIGRNWVPRVRHAGTYDLEWLDNQSPFWPDDFDYAYFQSAPPDQQIPYLQGGEEIVLRNLSPAGRATFSLPRIAMPVWLVPQRGPFRRVDGVIDTLVIEPDLNRFTLCWRVSATMKRSCFDMKQVIAGEMPESWQRAQKYGNKPYYKGLAELVRAKTSRRT